MLVQLAKELTGSVIFIRTEDGKDVENRFLDHEYFVNPPLAIVSNIDMNIVEYRKYIKY